MFRPIPPEFDPRGWCGPSWKNPNHLDNYHIPAPRPPVSVASEFPCKDSYVGAPVKAVMPAGEYCHNCDCHGTPKPHCGCGCHSKHNHGAICSVVVDDANERVYLYGDIMHEDYHVPGADCVAYAAVKTAGFEVPTLREADEYWEGVQDNNTVRPNHTPFLDNTFLVFLNGVKQREGAEHDFVITPDGIHFNFHDLLDTDVVELMYRYKEGE